MHSENYQGSLDLEYGTKLSYWQVIGRLLVYSIIRLDNVFS